MQSIETVDGGVSSAASPADATRRRRTTLSALFVSSSLLTAARGQDHIDVLHVLEGQPGEQLGRAVDGVGDVNADGHDDFFVVSAYSTTIRSGKDASILYAYHLPPWTSTYSRGAVTGLGDVDHDGHDDYAVSDPGSDQACTDCGTVTLYSGQTGSVLLTLHGDTGARIFGAALAAAGDVDADGTPDLLVGAPTDPFAFDTVPSAILVHSGADGALLRQLECHCDTGSTYDSLGAVMANAGDVDADGVDDVITAYAVSYLSYYKGSYSSTDIENGIKLFSGADGRLLLHDADVLARRVAGLGDLDGDGHADFAVSDASQAVRIRSGATGSQLFVLSGTGPNFGDAVSRAGDVDCDGVGDILVADPSTPSAAHVYSGQDFLLLASLPTGGWGTWGALGRTVGFVGDANGDGKPDLIVADPLHTSATAYSKVTVFSVGTGSAAPYGGGCAGSGGFTPVLAASGCHLVQSSVGFEISQGLGGALAWLLPSLAAGSTPVGGCEVLVDLGLSAPGLLLPLVGSGAGQGSATLTALVPPGFPVDVPIYLQAFVLDGASATGWAGSNAIAWSVDQFPGAGLPHTWWVDDDPPTNDPGTGASETPFREIQAALDAADHGDTILVRDGYYSGPGNRGLRFFGKRLTLRSTGGPLACVVDAEGAGSVFAFDHGETADSVLAGFTITGGHHDFWGHDGSGVSITNSGPTVRNCLIRGNMGVWGGGIHIAGGNPRIENCEISDNIADEGGFVYTAHGAGIWCAGAAATIRNCTIRNNNVAYPGAYGGAGIEFSGDHGTLVTNCIIRGNNVIGVISLYDDLWAYGGSPTVRYSNVGGQIPGAFGGNSWVDPAFLPLGPDGISHLSSTSPCIDAGDPAYVAAPGETDIDGQPRVAGGRVDMGADEVP